jgi:hypothetical protein
MTATQPITEDLTRIEALVMRANTQVAAGYACDLTNLDAAIQQICRTVETVPADQAGPVHTRLLALFDELGHLAERIDENLAMLGDRLEDNAKRRQAASAYAQPPKRER